MDEIDKQILYELDVNCRIPDTRLAKIVGKSNEAVRYRMRKLQEEGIITGYTTLVDGTMMGFEAHKIYFHTREKPELVKEFLEYIRTQHNIFWLGTGDGAWNVGVTFFVKNKLEFFRQKNEIFSRFRKLVTGQRVGTVVEANSFGKKFLCKSTGKTNVVRALGKVEKYDVDEIDVEILDCLIREGRMSYVEIARHVKLTPEAVRGRVKSLENARIISNYNRLKVDYRKLGYEFYKTFFYFEGLVQAEEKRLFEAARRHPNVVNYLKVLAPWDIELEIMAENYHAYNEIINYFREKFSGELVKVETTILNADELLPSKSSPEMPRRQEKGRRKENKKNS